MKRWLFSLCLCARVSLACVDTDPERLACPIPERAALRARVVDEQGIRPEVLSATRRLISATLRGQGIDIRFVQEFPDGEQLLPGQVTIRYVSKERIMQAYLKSNEPLEPDRLRGYADLRAREAYVRTMAQERLDEYWCPSAAASSYATTALHEIGHLLGLPHPEEVVGTSIPINGSDLRWNLMLQGVPRERPACERELDTLSSMDVAGIFERKQGELMRSSASGGAIWKRLMAAEFNFERYVDRYAQDIATDRGSP